MKNLTLWICLISSSISGSLQAESYSVMAVDSLLAIAADTTLTFKERVEILEKARDYDTTGKAMHGLARLYMNQRSLMSKANTEHWLKRALKKEPDNSEYLASYAEFYWRIGQRNNSYAHARQALENDPNHVWALYLAGRYAIWKLESELEVENINTTYPVILDGENPTSTIDFPKGSPEILDMAFEYLTRATTLDSKHWPTLQALGILYHQTKQYRKLIHLFEDYRQDFPDNPMGHFFTGMGYQLEGDFSRAYQMYHKGLMHTSEEDQKWMQAIFIVEDPDQLQKDEIMPNAETLRKFWSKRDPILLTSFNERLLEHCRRVAYVNLRFSDPILGTEGWKTHKGQAYIRYGHPEMWGIRPADTDRMTSEDRSRWIELGPLSYEFKNRAELWVYDGFKLVFVNSDSRDAWDCEVAWKDQTSFSFGNFVNRYPDYYSNPSIYEIPYQIGQFRAPNGKTRVELFYALPGSQIHHQKTRPGVHSVKIENGRFLFNARRDTVHKDITQIQMMPQISYRSSNNQYLLGGERLLLAPGAYLLVEEAKDLVTQTVGTFRDSLEIRKFSRDSLEVSSLLLARKIVHREQSNYGRDQFMILSNPLAEYEKNGQVAFYFEIYNLTKNEWGQTHYEETYQVQISEAGRLSWMTAISHTNQGDRDWVPRDLTVDLKGIEPGIRRFRVLVKDLHSHQQAISSTEFSITW